MATTRKNTALRAAMGQLAELLEENPELLDVVQSLTQGEGAQPTKSAEVEAPKEWIGEVTVGANGDARPLLSKSGQSVKYEGEAFATDSEGVEHKVIVVAYLPPKAAREHLTFALNLDGEAVEGRKPKARS